MRRDATAGYEHIGLEEGCPEDHIIAGLLDDITDRCGLRDEWDSISSDVQRDIIDEWREIIRSRATVVLR